MAFPALTNFDFLFSLYVENARRLQKTTRTAKKKRKEERKKG